MKDGREGGKKAEHFFPIPSVNLLHKNSASEQGMVSTQAKDGLVYEVIGT